METGPSHNKPSSVKPGNITPSYVPEDVKFSSTGSSQDVKSGEVEDQDDIQEPILEEVKEEVEEIKEIEEKKPLIGEWSEEDEQKDWSRIPTQMNQNLIDYKVRLFKHVADDDIWKVGMEKNDIVAYSCDGRDNFKGFKAETELPFSLAEISIFLMNKDNVSKYEVSLELSE